MDFFKRFSLTEVICFKCKVNNIKAKIVRRSSRYFFVIKNKDTNVSYHSFESESNTEKGYFVNYKDCFIALKEFWKNFDSQNYPFD